MDRFWARAAAKGKDANPVPRVIPADRGCGGNRSEGGRGIRQACRILLSQAPAPADRLHLSARQCRLQESLEHLDVGKRAFAIGDLSIELKPLKAKDMIDKEFVVIGSPATVRDKLEAMAKRLNVGHLMVALQFGSMPHAQAQEEYRAVRARGSAASAEPLGRPAVGEPLVAKAVAQAALAATRDGVCLTGPARRAIHAGVAHSPQAHPVE